MQEDSFPAAERILSDIESVFLKDPELKEFDILPITLNKNKSPVHHVQNCLGLELWCVRHVYCYAYHRLLDLRQNKNRRADPEIQTRLLMGALLLNPDVQTFWNMRRELVQACRLDCQAELHFCSVVLSRKPKCAEAFSYRKWIVKKIEGGGKKVTSLLTRELEVARAAANRYANNYHAWQHSIWSLVHLAPCVVHPESYLEEWAASKLWVTMHISDHSGWQYRQFLLQQLCGPVIDRIPPTSIDDHLHEYIYPLFESCNLLKQPSELSVAPSADEMFQSPMKDNIVPDFKDCFNMNIVLCLNLVLSEIDLSTDLITRYPGHEALWYHRRFLLSFLKSVLEQSECNSTDGENTYGAVKGDCMNLNRSLHVKLNCYNSDTGSAVHSQINESSQKVTSSSNTRVLHERAREILKLVAQALPRHEERILNLCVGGDSNQQRFCSQYHKWLVQVLCLSVVF